MLHYFILRRHYRKVPKLTNALFQLYRSAELAECTDLCVCEASLQVSCKVACVPRAPCSSRLAHYSHAAPAYQAYRGRCYCYSGSFICMRPNPGTSIYLFGNLFNKRINQKVFFNKTMSWKWHKQLYIKVEIKSRSLMVVTGKFTWISWMLIKIVITFIYLLKSLMIFIVIVFQTVGIYNLQVNTGFRKAFIFFLGSVQWTSRCCGPTRGLGLRMLWGYCSNTCTTSPGTRYVCDWTLH